MRAEIISIGTEILLGEITDTNASFLASQLPLLGVDLYWVSQVGDNQVRLVEVLKRAWQRSELILTSGGLGPTEDDLTRGAIAEMLGEALEIKPSLESDLREYFANLDVEMPLSNLRQAATIPSAEPLSNTRGTAPGWWVERDGRLLVAMPGPSVELQEMWHKEVQPGLQKRSAAIILSKTIKTAGLGEAAMGELVSPLLSGANPTLGIYAKVDGIHLRLTAKAESQQKAEKMIAEGEVSLRALAGKYVWGTDNETLETVVGQLLTEKGLSLASMEGYSGGWLALSLTDIPGNTVFFKGGLVANSDEFKIASGVDARIISEYGPVSSEVAQAMAEAVRVRLGADIGIGITGIEVTESTPTGIVYFGITDGRSSRESRTIVRARGKQRVVATALSGLRRLLISPD